VASGVWPKRIADAADAASAERSDQSVRVKLLEDIKTAFVEKGGEITFSETLVGYLVSLEHRPWVEWKHGRPLSKARLGRLLSSFGITSQTVRIGPETAKGYRKTDFDDAFSRYTPFQSVTTSQA
jgi:uncharacterized protein DUF3631